MAITQRNSGVPLAAGAELLMDLMQHIHASIKCPLDN